MTVRVTGRRDTLDWLDFRVTNTSECEKIADRGAKGRFWHVPAVAL